MKFQPSKVIKSKTNYYQSKMLKDGRDPTCRICSKFQEIVDDIPAGCPELAKSEYIHRKNKAAIFLHWNI